MGDGSYRLSAAVCAMPASDADKLIAAGSGDCALLYIYLLRCGPAPDEELCRALGMDAGRLAAAAGKLRSLGLLATGAQRLPPAQELPQYTSEEVVRRTGEDPAFRGVLSEAERLLGHTLSGADTRTLFGIYDFLGLPVDVMMLLMHHCAEECRLKYGPGLGKTFLSACIARVVAERGFSVAYESASAALGAFEAQRFSRDTAEGESAASRVREYLGCDLMILDDLGTEMVTSFSVSALYQLVNTRLGAGRQTIISTNAGFDELARKYGPQIMSRLEGEYLLLPFSGRDIRLLRKERGI